MSANAAAELPASVKSATHKVGEAVIKGKLVGVKRPQGNSQWWENLIIMPAPDPYSSPSTVSVLSSQRLGDRDEDVTVRVRIGVTFGSTSASGGASVSFKNVTIDAILAAVEGDSRFRYVAEPSLRVLDGQVAKLMVGSEVPVRGSTVVDRSGNPVQAVEYRSAGVQLTVEPRIFAEMIVAKVSQEVSSFAVTTTSGIDSPTMMKRSALTVIDLRPGEVVALAGLDETRETTTRSGLSWLPFDFSRSGSNSRSQILLFLQAEAG